MQITLRSVSGQSFELLVNFEFAHQYDTLLAAGFDDAVDAAAPAPAFKEG